MTLTPGDRTPSQAGQVQFGAEPAWPGPRDITLTRGPLDSGHDEAGWSGTDPLSETTLAELRELAARYPEARSALLPMLHLVQSSEGYVTAAGLQACADILGITAAEVAGVATFYSMYKRRPIGEYHVGVCTNTLCAIMGGDAIFERLKSHLDVGNDETTSDGKVTLEHIECNAACDYAPVVMVNWEFFDDQTPQSATDLVDELRSGREVTATRGARLCTWRDAERVLAGFPDDRADEGPAGGPATLVGLRLARENSWTAPRSQNREDTTEQATAGDGPARSGTDAMRAVKQSHTQRAESETVVDVDTSAGDDGPPSSDDNTSDGKGDPTR
ncbi:MAG: NADH-quinone oxidoreductase subunit [Nocardioidaceae bacterium]|jgi:NADH-quinone oxidoreductase subunit E|nr:NADH-quinone oxidoreductase subunit [Nocardioidaceae bacterium]